MNSKGVLTLVFQTIKQHGPISAQGIAELTNKSTETIDAYLRMLARETPKCIYIHSYNRAPSSANGKRLWAFGNEPNAEKPRPGEMTQEIREAREDAEARRKALMLNRVHRDPMLFFTCGRAP